MNTTSKTHNAGSAFQSNAKRNMFYTTSNDSGFVSPKDRPPDMSSLGDVLPSQYESVVFPVSHKMQANIRLSGNGVGPNSGPDMPLQDTVGQLIRPKSPTQQCSIPKADTSHFNLALMEPKVGSELSERIFHVQQHELVCAISSETAYLDNAGCMLSSVDINYYWCNFCTFSTCTKTLLMQHVMDHRFHCKYCRYQSFSRADVIHHASLTHPEFQEIAAVTKYCVLLSDYLRISHPQEKQLDNQRKRKHQVQDADDVEEISNKVRYTGNQNVKEKVQEKYVTDYVLFDVSIENTNTEEKVDEELTRKRSNSSPPLLEEMGEEVLSQEKGASSSPGPVISAVSDPPSLFPKCELTDSVPSVESGTGEGRQNTHGVPELTLPPQLMPEEPAPSNFHQPLSCSASSNFSCATLSPTPSPPSLSSISMGSLPKVQSDWICAYCKFTCTSQSDMNVHCSRHHQGMPPQCVSPIELDERSAPPILKYLDGKLSSAAADQDCEMHSVHDDPFSSNQTYSVPDHISLENGSADEPPVLVKQESVESNVSSNSLEADMSIPTIETHTVASLRCYHCSYTSHHLDSLRNHIITSHRGKSLTGLDLANKRIFLCCKTSCEFTSSFGQSYLDHAQDCMPWRASDSTSCPLEKSVVECLQATARLAEHDAKSSAHSSASSVTGPAVKKDRNFSCTYCKNQYFSSDKNQTKQHILKIHASKCLVMRDVYAHSKRRKSTLYFCRWCSWEGLQKTDHDLHSVFCPHQSKSTAKRYNDSKNAVAGPYLESSSAVQMEDNADINTGHKMECDNVNKQELDKHQDQECSGHGTSNTPSHASSAQDSSVDSSHFVHNQKVKNEDSEHQTDTSLQATTTADDNKLAHDQDLANNETDRPSFPMLSFGDSSLGPVEDFDVLKTSPIVSIPSDDMHHTDLLSDGKLSPKSESQLSHNENTNDSSHHSHMSVNGSVTEESAHQPHASPGETSRSSYCRLISNTSSNDSRNAADVIDISENSVESDSLPDISDNMDRVTPQLSSGAEFAANSNDSCASNVVISGDSNHASSSADNSLSSINTSHPTSPDHNAYENRASISYTKSPPNTSSHMTVDDNSVDPIDSKPTAEGSAAAREQAYTGSFSDMFHSDTAQPSRQLVEHSDKKFNKHKVHSGSENSSSKKKEKKDKVPMSPGKKYKTVWCDGSKIQCTLCDFISHSLTSLKMHILGNHSHQPSFPFKSVRHREKHHKSSFYACPSLECFMCNFDESIVVRHYRKHHSSQHHAYMDPAFVPHPLKARCKTGTKETKNVNSSSKPTSHIAKPHTHLKEKPYMCLYCEDRKYTDSVPGMKVHQLACHAGQTVIVRDVLAHREKRLSRIFVCDQPHCDFISYDRDKLDQHMKMQHADQLLALADRSYQCVACGWIATDDSKVQSHVSAMHQSEGGATVVTLAHGDDQRAVEERFVKSSPLRHDSS